MRLIIKQEVAAIEAEFNVKDEAGNLFFRIRGEKDYVHKNLHIFSVQGKELALFRKEGGSVPAIFDVFFQGKRVARIEQKFKIGTAGYDVRGPGWTVKGAVGSHTFSVFSGQEDIATISRSYNPVSDRYVLDYKYPGDAVLLLAVVLAIDVGYGNVRGISGC